MKAIVIKQFGAALDVFETMELPRPRIAAHEVLVKVQYSSVNPVDCKIRSGAAAGLAPAFPAVLHGDVSGIVEEVGADVQHIAVGDRVFGCAGGLVGTGGALADYMKGDARLFVSLSQEADLEAHAALALVGITAFEALVDRAKIQKGQKVLVYGGTGGVGHIGVQLAKWLGAEVYATVSTPESAQLAMQFGATATINYKEETVEGYVEKHTQGKGFDVVFDTVGGQHLTESFKATKLNGTVVTTASRGEIDLSEVHRRGLNLQVVFMLIPLLHQVGLERHTEILQELANLVQQGHLQVLIDQQKFTFEQAGQAHQHAESGRALGKIILSNS